jgi:hypothetical protein
MGSHDDRRCVACPGNDCRALSKCHRGFAYNRTRDACEFCGVWNGVSCACPEGTIDNEWANYHGVRVCVDVATALSAGQVAALAVGLFVLGCVLAAAVTWLVVVRKRAYAKQ